MDVAHSVNPPRRLASIAITFGSSVKVAIASWVARPVRICPRREPLSKPATSRFQSELFRCNSTGTHGRRAVACRDWTVSPSSNERRAAGLAEMASIALLLGATSTGPRTRTPVTFRTAPILSLSRFPSTNQRGSKHLINLHKRDARVVAVSGHLSRIGSRWKGDEDGRILAGS